jgi:Zn-dependent alcohol dehydrogenase
MPIETDAAVLHAFREPQRIERVELRDPGPGEVLVRMVAAGVCHSDVGQADGEWTFPLPVVLGHEGAGVVEALGPDVSNVAVGQRVVLSLASGCNSCDHCVAGRPILCQSALDAMNAGVLMSGSSPISGDGRPIATYSLIGCFAAHAVVAAASAIPLPEGMPAEVAALIGCAVTTGLGAATETLAIEAGSRGAVIGAGGVGVNAIQGRAFGVHVRSWPSTSRQTDSTTRAASERPIPLTPVTRTYSSDCAPGLATTATTGRS